MECVEFAYVWREEQEILTRLASEVPAGGLVVEIGTALGGTAFLMWRAAHARGIAIHTVDLFPCQRARTNLASTDVRIVNESSDSYARRFDQAVGRPIDLLYIDGDHTLAGISQDFASWIGKVRPGGQVAFHDYDPPERGHVAHLAVGVFLDTVKRLGLFDGVRQECKMLLGTARHGVRVPSAGDCFETLRAMARETLALGEEVFRDGVEAGMRRLVARGGCMTSLQACGLLNIALERDFECLDRMTNNFHVFRRHLEQLQFLEHAYGKSPFPAGIMSMEPPADIRTLSATVAAEQVRVSLLAGVLRTLVAWDV